MYRSFQGSEPADVRSHSDYLKGRYKRARFTNEQEEWPPDQPKHFTSLTLIHHKGGHTEREVIAITKATDIDDAMSSGCLQNASSEPSQEQVTRSKDIKEIFVLSEDDDGPHSILIEGAPGIGKTILSKEISVQWANGQLLVNTLLLFLIFLRDPVVRTITSLKDLVKYYYRFDENSNNIANSCADYLVHSGGVHVTLVLDGYDEYPENLRQSSFISDILQHKVLPYCHLVITSRPHASAHLRTNCDRYIKILGFTKEDRQKYIEDSLKEKQDVDKLVEYLDNHLTINSLCFIPFNMTVLLWLYKQGIILANSSTELYNHFICHTIRHHLAKYRILHDNFVDLSVLEDPYRQVIQQLAFLSYRALEKNQLSFTLVEIKTVCPQIDEIPGALNGFGLLQAVEHFGIKQNTTLNFVHLTVQEFLAAYHITCLSHYEEFCILKDNFMSDFYVNTFTMYVGMTKGQRPAFKQYLNGSGDWTAYIYGIFGRLNLYSPSIRINPKLLDNHRTCFRLFKCFHEAGDEVLCSEISNKYSRCIVAVFDTLLPSDIECLGVFLCSRREWQGLHLRSIDDNGIQVLHQLLTNKTKSTCIHELFIADGGSQSNSTSKISSSLITEIAKSCKTKVLDVLTLLLEDALSLKNQLTELTLYVEENQTSIITFVPILLDDNKVLKELTLLYEESSEDSMIALVEAFKCTYTLVELEKFDGVVAYKMENVKVRILMYSTHRGSPYQVALRLREVADGLKHTCNLC